MKTKELKDKLYTLYLEMYGVACCMEEFGDKETQEHGKELLNASKMCKEWVKHVKATG